MGKTNKNKPRPGKEYWSKRPLSNAHGASRGRVTKEITHSKERMTAKQELIKAPREPEYDEREYVAPECQCICHKHVREGGWESIECCPDCGASLIDVGLGDF